MTGELQYLNLLEDVLTNGKYREDRTGTGTYSVFGRQARYNLQEGFPLLTSKKMFTKGIIHELLWFLSGNTNIKYLNDNGVHIWDEWADDNGDLNKIYGYQWRHWGNHDGYGNLEYIDQIKTLINNMKKDPFSRRHIVSAWNVADLDKMALPPCHTMFQFYVEEIDKSIWWSQNKLEIKNVVDVGIAPKYKLSCQLYQRSGDIFLGIPFNIAQYALLTHMITHVCGYAVGEFVHSIGDLHLYSNHVEQAKLQLTRRDSLYKLPRLWLNPDITDIDYFKFNDIKIIEYKSHPAIKGDVAV